MDDPFGAAPVTLALPEDHLRWLADADGPLFQMDTGIDVLRQDIPMPEAIGCGWLEIFHLPLDMRLIKAVHRFHPGTSQRLVPLARAHFSFPEPTFMVQAAQQGRFGHQEFYPPCELTFGQGQELFRYADRLETIPLLDTTANSEMISLSIGRNLLHRLLGEAEAEQLLAGLNLSAPPMVQVLAMPRHLTTALHACLSATLTGAAKKLHAQAKVLEYLSQLVQYRSSNSREPALTVRRRDKIHQLREELTCQEGKLPTLDDLALRYGWADPRTYDPAKATLSGRQFSLEHMIAQTLLVRGRRWGRDRDHIAVGAALLVPSMDYRSSAPGRQAKIEENYEIYYMFQATPNVAVSPDFQLIRKPFGCDAVVNGESRCTPVTSAGLRAEVAF